MQRSFLFLIFLISFASFGQDQVKWDFNVQDGVFEAKATIAEGWHLYSQHIENEIGPIPTSFSFEENSKVELLGSVQEPEPLKEYDANFEGELNFFKDEVKFQQGLKYEVGAELNGSVTYMVCNATMCLPPTDKNFTIKLN